jgi:hypothetical protein
VTGSSFVVDAGIDWLRILNEFPILLRIFMSPWRGGMRFMSNKAVVVNPVCRFVLLLPMLYALLTR